MTQLLENETHGRTTGLINKDDSISESSIVHAQVKVEEDMVAKWLKEGCISKDIARKIGLPRAAKEIDKSSLLHVYPFMNKSLEDAEAQAGCIRDDELKLGIDPSVLENQPEELEKLKKYIGSLLARTASTAAEKIKEETKKLWATEIDIEKSTKNEGEELEARDRVALAKQYFIGGGVFLDKIVDLIKEKVRQPFEADTTGDQQISRFRALLDYYEGKAQALVHDKFKDFREDLLEDLKLSLRIGNVSPKVEVSNVIVIVVNSLVDNVVKPLFTGLHREVCDAQDTPWKYPLVEVHAAERNKLNEKAAELQKIIQVWKDLLDLHPKDKIEQAFGDSLDHGSGPGGNDGGGNDGGATRDAANDTARMMLNLAGNGSPSSKSGQQSSSSSGASRGSSLGNSASLGKNNATTKLPPLRGSKPNKSKSPTRDKRKRSPKKLYPIEEGVVNGGSTKKSRRSMGAISSLMAIDVKLFDNEESRDDLTSPFV